MHTIRFSKGVVCIHKTGLYYAISKILKLKKYFFKIISMLFSLYHELFNLKRMIWEGGGGVENHIYPIINGDWLSNIQRFTFLIHF